MTGRELYRTIIRRHDPLREGDLTERRQAVRLWAVLLESTTAAEAFLAALERQPRVLELDVDAFAHWCTSIPGVSDGRAGTILAALYGVSYLAHVDAAPAQPAAGEPIEVSA